MLMSSDISFWLTIHLQEKLSRQTEISQLSPYGINKSFPDLHPISPMYEFEPYPIVITLTQQDYYVKLYSYKWVCQYKHMSASIY